MIAFIYPIVATIWQFMEKKGYTAEEERMHQAWFMSVVLQVTLWSQQYAREQSLLTRIQYVNPV